MDRATVKKLLVVAAIVVGVVVAVSLLKKGKVSAPAPSSSDSQ